MFLTRNFKQFATAFWCSIAVHVSLSGCSVGRGVPEKRYQHALRLIDDGTISLRAQRFDEAAAAFEAALELAPLAAGVDGLGCVMLYRGDLLRAEQLFKEAYSMDNGYHDALANLGLALDLQGKKDAAAEAYRSYLAISPEAAHARNNLFVLEYEAQRDTIGRVMELRKASLFSRHGVIVDNLRLLEQSFE